MIQSALLLPIFLATSAVAVFNKDYSPNLGGIGSAADKILYELISEETVDSGEGYALTI